MLIDIDHGISLKCICASMAYSENPMADDHNNITIIALKLYMFSPKN